MSWTNAQKSLFAQACAAIGYGQDQRHMILSGFPNASVPGKDHPTSTSKRLNNADFEHVMAVVESVTPGRRIELKNKRFAVNHFTRKAEGDSKRMDHRIDQLVEAIQAKLPGFELEAFIERITGGEKDSRNTLTYKERQKLIEGLKGCCRTYNVKVA